MNTGQDLSIDDFASESDDGNGKRLTTWYAQGHADGLGDRLLMFDNTSAPSWEILRFKPALARDSRFEAALRDRVERLTSFEHPAFPVVRPIKKLGHDDGLAVVSTYASGVSLAEALKKPRSAEFSVRLIRQLAPALAAFQRHASGVAHGALTVDRIVLTPEGQLMIREHMVGSAIESLGWPAARLWAEFGILAPPTAAASPTLDERSDVTQLALVALSLMTGRRIDPVEYPEKVSELLDEITRRNLAGGPGMIASLRRWLERALQLSDQPFESAQHAAHGLSDLQDEPRRDDVDPALPEAIIVQPAVVPVDVPAPSASSAPAAPRTAWERLPSSDISVRAPLWSRVPQVIRWGAIAVGVLALGEGLFIAQLLYNGSKAQPVVESRAPIASTPPRAEAPAGSQPAATSLPAAIAAMVDPGTPAIRDMAAGTLPPITTAAKLPEPGLAPAAPVRNGGFRVSAPVEVHVLDGERVVGSSTEGAIIAAAGQHEYEFVNNVIGYRVRRVVDIRAGRITPVSVAVPNGNLNINATPWAAVWIDGTSYGETPLGNLAILPGEHEIVFRHPELGERRQKTIVRVDGPTRVAVNLQR